MKLNWTIEQYGAAHASPEISYSVSKAETEQFSASLQERIGMRTSNSILGLFDSFEQAQEACETDADERLKQ